MNLSYIKASRKSIGALFFLLVSMVVLLAACGSSSSASPSPIPTSAGTAASPTPSMTTTTAQGTAATTRTTTKATRALNGPQAQSSQLIVKTGETQAVAARNAGNELVFIWVEVENLTGMEFTVSSLLSVSVTDKVTGGPSIPPNVPDTLIRLSSIDSDALTLDGKLAARGRISGWIYAEFPAGVSLVAAQLILTGTDGTKSEPLTVEISL